MTSASITGPVKEAELQNENQHAHYNQEKGLWLCILLMAALFMSTVPFPGGYAITVQW